MSQESGVVLVADGVSTWRVSLRAEPTGPEGLAASELVKYVKRISEAELAVIREETPSDNVIRINAGNATVDGFDLEVTRERITISGHNPRGALYGAYELLERMGCRWYYIGELGEVVPNRTDIVLATGSVTQVPSFRERSIVMGYPSYFDRFDEWIDFLTKMRINNIYVHINGKFPDFFQMWQGLREKYLSVLQQRQTIIEWGGHHLEWFVPRELFAAHPEYFRMNRDGERTGDCNFCPNSGAVDVLKRGIRPYLEEMPEVTYFHFYAADLEEGGWCHCPQCAALSPADQNMMAMNAIAEVLAEVAPEAALSVATYHDYEEVSGIEPAHNLFMLHCPRERCYAHAFDDPECRRNREEYLQRWLDIRSVFHRTAPNTIHEFLYYIDGILDREMQPPQVEMIPADARYFRSLDVPVHQSLMVSFRRWHSPPFSLIVSSRAAWNADVDGWGVMADFCRHYYGEAAANEMEAYYRKVEDAMKLFFRGDEIVGPYTDMRLPPMDPKMRKAKIADAKKACQIHDGLYEHLTKVLDGISGGVFAQRVRRERDICLHHDLQLKLVRCQLEGRFLGLQFLNGIVDEAEGRRALELLAEGIKAVGDINAWIARFPEEQSPLIAGFQAHHDGYAKILSDLEEQVRKELETDSSTTP